MAEVTEAEKDGLLGLFSGRTWTRTQIIWWWQHRTGSMKEMSWRGLHGSLLPVNSNRRPRRCDVDGRFAAGLCRGIAEELASGPVSGARALDVARGTRRG